MIVPTNPEERMDLILDYLLDELPPEQIAAMDSDLFEDEELTSQFAEGKADLIDAYAAGRLNPLQQQRFRRLLAADPSLESLTPFSQAFNSVQIRATKAHHSPAPRRKLPYAIVALAAIAATLLIVLFPHQPRPANNPRTQADTATTVAKNDSPHADSIYPVILSPSTLRGEQDSDVIIPASADKVKLQILLPAESKAPAYIVSLEGNNPAIQLRQSTFTNLPAKQNGSDTYLELTLSSSDLQASTYILRVTDQLGMLIHSYSLKIVQTKKN